jgi:hypothetical protein
MTTDSFTLLIKHIFDANDKAAITASGIIVFNQQAQY